MANILITILFSSLNFPFSIINSVASVVTISYAPRLFSDHYTIVQYLAIGNLAIMCYIRTKILTSRNMLIYVAVIIKF